MKLDSMIAINFVLLFLLATMSGTLWFLLPTRESIEQARLMTGDAGMVSFDSRVRDTRPAPDPGARWRAELARADRELRSLRQRREQLAQELSQSTAGAVPETPAPPPDPQDARQLVALLAERRAELAMLKLAGDPGQSGAEPSLAVRWRADSQGKEPVWLQLYNGRVLAVNERNYSVRTIDAAGIAFRVLRRTSPGETFQEAMANGSKLQLALSGIVSAKQYFRCLVAGDSFALLRAIASLAAEKGIDLDWEPYQDEDGRVVFTPREAGGFTTPR